jgi:uncharacterized protein (TIGR03067 family)
MRACLILCVAAGLAHGAAPPQQDRTNQIGPLITQLGDDEYARREAASKALEVIGEKALPQLRKAASSADLEVRRRARKLVGAIMRRAAERELKKLEGTWLPVSIQTNGKQAPIDLTLKVVIKDGVSVATTRPVVSRYTWQIVDATSVPKKVNLVAGGQVFQAIYELDGQKLKYVGSNTKRPGEFSTRNGDGRYMATLKRAKK